MIDIYYWPTPNGHKVTIFLEEAGIPYRLVPVDIGAGDQFTPQFLEISPNNRMPAMVDPDGPDGKAIAIFESGAILIYLAEKYGQFMPKDTRGRFAVIQWVMWQMANVGPMLGQTHHFRMYAPEVLKKDFPPEEVEKRVKYGVRPLLATRPSASTPCSTTSSRARTTCAASTRSPTWRPSRGSCRTSGRASTSRPSFPTCAVGSTS